ncbi:hypothetical protein AncyloWKF20_08665 [Ancylobacter sp. WKF20]|uniref:hypothetical protein n=1 Tax=Ancylobacter sp. WKF20 TaxID=3039801 RepID=UPI0024345A1C|nr:hypothetical protein [Ancylobacter sp. WKF20]WGD31875.1 hypothetical protein AncyloWKF20_08665 [Ancylobacter sp. WKF20]
MEPTLRGGWDYVLVRACTQYEGEGIYLVGNSFGSWDLRRASNVLAGKGQIRLTVDNRHYGERLVSADWFDENVLAVVVADVKIREQRLLEAACRQGRAA